MKKIILITLLSGLYLQPAFSQSTQLPSEADFYDLIELMKTKNPENTGEGSIRNFIESEEMIWAPRLYPSGDFALAAKAIQK
ncbi:MAG: hypothetical protein JEZ03_09150 [Bacteroidales bacterium]|nr:hypothetical protein [Bacteroidales bacterium]